MDNKSWGTGEPGRPYTMGEIQEAARAQMQEKTCGGTAQEAKVPRVAVLRYPYTPQPLPDIKSVVLTLTETEARKLRSVLGSTCLDLGVLYSGLFEDLRRIF